MLPHFPAWGAERLTTGVILDFIHGLRGELHVTFEEGTWATWLYDLLKPHVTKLVVCDPRKNSRRGTRMTGSMHASWLTGCT
jgi:hypothetical protein